MPVPTFTSTFYSHVGFALDLYSRRRQTKEEEAAAYSGHFAERKINGFVIPRSQRQVNGGRSARGHDRGSERDHDPILWETRDPPPSGLFLALEKETQRR